MRTVSSGPPVYSKTLNISISNPSIYSPKNCSMQYLNPSSILQPQTGTGELKMGHRWGLTSAKWKGTVTSLDPLTTLLLNIAKLTLFMMRVLCGLIFSLVPNFSTRATSHQLLAYVSAWTFSVPGAGLCTSLHCTSEVFC